LGSNTNSVKCTGATGESANTVGGSFDCNEGANLVAVGPDGETVIRTNI